MSDLKYALLIELTNRLQADLLEGYLEAHGVDTELFQESVGHTIYPVIMNSALGRVQVFVPKEQLKEAQELLQEFSPEE
ncbi:MAG: DUF2007 domain-containing protein [Anaerolineales bacterium]|nr:DUF2007 domain-containing protein [Anaerolineales bacterium]